MKTWMRFAAVGGLSMSLLLAGCGREEAGTAEGPGESIADGPAEGDITVWAMGAEGENLSVMADAFMRDNPDANVKVTPIPWDGAHDKIANAIAAGETPDVALIGTTWMGEFARTGGLDPTPADLIDETSFFDGAWDTTVVDGVSYGVPWYVETRLLYVNKDVARAAGVDKPAENWEELADSVRAFQEEGGAEWGISLQPGGTGAWQTVMPLVWQNGGDAYDGDQFTFDSPQVVEAFDYYRAFFSEGMSPTDLPEGSLEPDFIADKIGAFVSGPWHMGVLADQDAADKYELWHMPNRQAATSFIGGGDLAVFKDSKNRDGAWKFVQYLSQPEVQVEWYAAAAALPAVEAAWEDPVLAQDPYLAAFGEQLTDAKSPPTIATWEQVAAELDSGLEELAKTDADSTEIAGVIQEQATSIGAGD